MNFYLGRKGCHVEEVQDLDRREFRQVRSLPIARTGRQVSQCFVRAIGLLVSLAMDSLGSTGADISLDALR